MFHIGWFGNFTAPEWKGPWVGKDYETWTNGRFLMDMCQAMEGAGFDYFMIEDSLMVPDAYGGTAEKELKHAIFSPKLDPAPLVPLMAAATKHMGIVVTLSTTFYPPWHLARLVSTLDHLTEGRVGWNIVTSSEDRAAQNYGLDKLTEHDLRYDMAEEFVDVVTQLWNSWEPDAVVADRENGVYADFTKVNPINFDGKFYKSRGPLNTPSSPQRKPVICQAGSSPKGRAFAARHADTILALSSGVPAMKEFRDDIRRRAVEAGRSPDDIKVLFVVSPILGSTEAEAQELRAQRHRDSWENVETQLLHMSGTSEIDFAQFDPDQPLPEKLSTNGHQGQLDIWRKQFGGRTIREAASAMQIESVPLVGTPDGVAGQMEDIMAEVGGDGFLFYRQPLSRRYVTEITEGLCPALRRRGLIREGYEHKLFRDNLLAF